MTEKISSICLIAAGLTGENLHLQPWRYLFEVGHQLHQLGYTVTLITDGSRSMQRDSLEGLPLQRLSDIRVFPALPSIALESTLMEIAPDLVLLHVGLTSFLHQDFRLWRRWPTIGIFTSPLYTPTELLRFGLIKLFHERLFIAIHLLGALAPRSLLHRNMQRSGLRGLVVQTQTTRLHLMEYGLWRMQIEVIPPGVDEVWNNQPPEETAHKRQSLGYTPEDLVVCYFGSLAPLRGLPLLIRAVELARRKQPSIKLLVLSRRRPGEMKREYSNLQSEMKLDGRGEYIHLVDGFLNQVELVRHVASCDVVVLPFELVPSDAPLSLLEVKALGIPLVTTTIACLPELASGSPHILVHPGELDTLASALVQVANEQKGGRLKVIISPRSWQTVGMDWANLLEGR